MGAVRANLIQVAHLDGVTESSRKWFASSKANPVETSRLDDSLEVSGTDCLKVGVQGAELLVLRGGEHLPWSFRRR